MCPPDLGPSILGVFGVRFPDGIAMGDGDVDRIVTGHGPMNVAGDVGNMHNVTGGAFEPLGRASLLFTLQAPDGFLCVFAHRVTSRPKILAQLGPTIFAHGG
jgi:hypothetical protein